MNAPTLHLPDVTLCAADTLHPQLALRALRRCMAQVRFARVLLCTDRSRLAEPTDDIEVIDVRIASRDEYSIFVLAGIAAHVRTSHVLLVQWDGWVRDAAAWRDEFLQYDYVGAPSLKFDYLAPPLPAAAEDLRVGNGGFSLRSRRLLDALASGKLELFHPEDKCICHHHRARLEREFGIRFVPPALGAHFSFERPYVAHPTFGFHGVFNLHRVLARAELLELLQQMPDDLRRHNETRKLIVQLLDLLWLPEAELLIDARWRHGMRDLRTLRLRGRLALGKLRLGLGWAAERPVESLPPEIP